MTLLGRSAKSIAAGHAVLAAIFAALLAILTISNPIDRLVWTVQARLPAKPVSGEIVFISAAPMSGAQQVKQKQELLQALSHLEDAGVSKIYLALPLMPAEETREIDQALAEKFRSLQSNLSMVYSSKISNYVSDGEFEGPDSYFSKNRDIVLSVRRPDIFGYSWWTYHEYAMKSNIYSTLSDDMARGFMYRDKYSEVDYTYDPRTIPQISLERIAQGRVGSENLTGKTVVIGNPAMQTSYAKMPGYSYLPPAYIDILGAETLRAGPTPYVGWWVPLLATLLGALCVIKSAKAKRLRRYAYLAMIVAVLTLPIIFAFLSIRAEIAAALIFLATYAGLRKRHQWRENQQLRDPRTDLPTFQALEADLTERDSAATSTIVVAKIHNYEAALSTLDTPMQSSYIHAIVDRLRVASRSMRIYTNGVDQLAWEEADSTEDQLIDHLHGLRAIFGTPLHIDGRVFDVSVTFGVDATDEPVARTKIVSAASAAAQTTEAFNPVVFANTSTLDERLWAASIQSKIDAALDNGEIYIVLQPQLSLGTGTITGAEALVRWASHERGNIPPSYFIEQCERAGRMDHLTRKVLKDAMTASIKLFENGHSFDLSVNISAAMFAQSTLYQIVEEALEETGFDPYQLILEITETAKILDHDCAKGTVELLQALGIRISADDFGMGAANYETILKLPFDELKIDRSFVDQLAVNPKARLLVAHIIAYAHDAGIHVVAEGVENGQTVAILKGMSCPSIQGYYISRPILPQEFGTFLQAYPVGEHSTRFSNAR